MEITKYELDLCIVVKKCGEISKYLGKGNKTLID
jgi:hypothetical protein